MEVKLDKNDRKILYELSKNARTNHQNIAKRTRLSRQVVSYRISRMEKSGVIRKFRLSVNYSAFGYSICLVCLSMRNFRAQDETEFIEFVKKNNHIVWVGRTSGTWDFLLYVHYRDLLELDNILQEIIGFKKEKIENMEILPRIKTCCFNILIGDLRADLKETSSRYQRDRGSFESVIKRRGFSHGTIRLDEMDRKIVDILGKNCTMPLTDIAKKLGTSKDTISYRIKRLIQTDIIHNFIIAIDMSKLGYQRYMILFELENFDDKEERRISSYLGNHRWAHFAMKTLGRKNLLVELCCKSTEEFSTILIEMRNFIGDILKTYSVIQILGEVKSYAVSKDDLKLAEF